VTGHRGGPVCLPGSPAPSARSRAVGTALYVIATASGIATTALLLGDATRYGALAVACLLIALACCAGGRVAMRRPAAVAPDPTPRWRRIATSTSITWITFFTVTRAMDPRGDWPAAALSGVVVATAMGVWQRLSTRGASPAVAAHE